MVAALEIAGPLAGWLVLFTAFLAGPRLGRAGSRRAGPHWAGEERGSESPAVVSWLAGRLGADGFTATLVDLAARGWCSLGPPRRGPGDPVICELPAETPIEELTPYERRAVGHLAQRAGTARRIPADALLDGFAGGEDEFRKAFGHEVVTDARSRGLTRPTLTASRKGLLCLLAFIPAGAALLTAHVSRHSGGVFALCGFYYLILCASAAGVDSDRLTPAGQAALRAWSSDDRGRPGARDAAYATALGRAPAPFTPRAKNAVWSGYGDRWRLLTIRDSTERAWPGLSAGAVGGLWVLVIPGLPILGVLGFLFEGGGHGAELGVLAGAVAIAALASKATARWAHLPRFAEFDGLVLRQWQNGTESDEGGIQYYVAVDDGVSEEAWAFRVNSLMFSKLVPGTVVHARVNPRLNKLLGVEPVRQVPAAPLLRGEADPRQAHLAGMFVPGQLGVCLQARKVVRRRGILSSRHARERQAANEHVLLGAAEPSAVSQRYGQSTGRRRDQPRPARSFPDRDRGTAGQLRRRAARLGPHIVARSRIPPVSEPAGGH